MTAPNPDSILDSIKKVIGFDPDYTAFDLDIIMFINATFGSLQQLGVGPDAGFMITDNTTLWASYTSRTDLLGMVKTYMAMKVKTAFDAPATSFAIAAIENQISQLEWRINVMAEQGVTATPPSIWWDLTGLSDFPSGAKSGDFGFDTSTWDVYVFDGVLNPGYVWDLTGLEDFPDEASVGEIGVDMTSGDLWKKA